MTDIVVVGSLNVDLTVRVPHLPVPGATVLGTGLTKSAGGKGLNQAVAASRLGRRVSMIGRVGDDEAADFLGATLHQEGISQTHVLATASPSGLALITVADDGENSIVVASGANAALTPADLTTAWKALDMASVVLVQCEVPLETVHAALAMSPGRVVLNTAPVLVGLDLSLLQPGDVLVANAGEADELDSLGAVTQAVDRGALVVVTEGVEGATMHTTSGTFHASPPHVDVVDTTGAGDSLCGALADALARGLPSDAALTWAVAAASVSVQRFGAQAGLPTAGEVVGLLDAGGSS